MTDRALRVRWLGRVRYQDAHALQRALFANSQEDYLLLLEHPHVYTMGVRSAPEHVLVEPGSVGAELVRVDRGGDVTYHGPGQLVGYPIVNVPLAKGSVPAHVHRIEQLIIDVASELGLRDVGRRPGYPGVWVEPGSERARKICSIGVRVSRGRSMHGFALNVAPDLGMFDHIVPCGIEGCEMTSLSAEGVEVDMEKVVGLVSKRASEAFGTAPVPTRRPARLPEDLARRPRERLMARAGVDVSLGASISSRKPEWLRARANIGEDYLKLRRTMRSLELVTVCEEAGCPNIYECWRDGTATFMINGDRCTRSCGFCLVDTRHPFPLDPAEPERVARAVEQMGLQYAVVTTVARDDLTDNGTGAMAATIESIRRHCPTTSIEVLISDCRGDEASLSSIFSARPDVLNHNLETVARLQRAVRTSASYARSLSVLGRAKAAGLVTKSGMMVGLGEDKDEIVDAMSDLAAVGVDIVTIGQYVRPSENHLPVMRYWTPDEFADLRVIGAGMGFRHVEASPLTRSSYHARQALSADDIVEMNAS